MSGVDELTEFRLLHARHGAGGANLTPAEVSGLPDGWRIIARRWDFRCWDALIRPPAPKVGWRLASPMARSRRKALKRAAAEIREHLAAEMGA